MFYENIKDFSPGKFKRMTGVRREVFGLMLDAVDTAKWEVRKHPTRGRPAKIGLADKLLLLLMYYREYRTMLHIGACYGVSESRTCEIISELEAILIGDGRFRLPGKKSLVKDGGPFEVVLVDVAESPVERPKKTTIELFGQKETSHAEDPDCRRCEVAVCCLYVFQQRARA